MLPWAAILAGRPTAGHRHARRRATRLAGADVPAYYGPVDRRAGRRPMAEPLTLEIFTDYV